MPHIFGDDWALFRNWKTTAAALLGVDPCDVCLVGSAAVGHSLNPHKGFRPFSEASDIDVAVVSGIHFDSAWTTLRNTKLSEAMTEKERNALKEHSRGLVFWGCIATDKVLRFLPFSKEWALAAIELAKIQPTEGREVNFRIYRDFASLRRYHLRNVVALRG